MVVLARMASSSILILVVICVAMAAQEKETKTSQNKVDKPAQEKTPSAAKTKPESKLPSTLDKDGDCGDHCTKDGEVDWIALIGKLFEMYQNFQPSKSSGGSPIGDALLSAFKGSGDSAKPKSTRDSDTASESKQSSSSAQPDLSAALLGSIISNLAKAGASSKKGGAADPMDGLKSIIGMLGALDGKGGSGADSLDFSKLTPMLLQMLPSLLGTKSDGSQLNLLSMLMPLLDGQGEGGELLKTLVSQGLKMFLNGGKSGKDDSHGPDLDSLLSLAELFTKDTLKEDTSAPRETPKSKLKTEL